MPDAPGAGCALEPQITRTRFVDESIAYLRRAFAVTDGFSGGAVTYGESSVALSDGPCPVADWTALSYTVAIDPARVPLELRETHDRVAAVWTLGGRKFVAFVASAAPNDIDRWQYGRMPDNLNAVARVDADPDAIDELVARVTAEQPAMTVTWLSALGILTLELPIGTFVADATGAGTIPQIDAVAAELRTSGLFDSLDWSGFALRVPNDSWPGAAIDGDLLAPECSRQHTRDLLDDGAFTTTPSFAAPLGTGPIARTPTCP